MLNVRGSFRKELFYDNTVSTYKLIFFSQSFLFMIYIHSASLTIKPFWLCILIRSIAHFTQIYVYLLYVYFVLPIFNHILYDVHLYYKSNLIELCTISIDITFEINIFIDPVFSMCMTHSKCVWILRHLQVENHCSTSNDPMKNTTKTSDFQRVD